MRILLPILFLMQVNSIQAQDILTPGRDAFDSKWMQNTSYQMIWYVLNDTSKMEIGKMTTEIKNFQNTLTVITNVGLKNSTAPWVDSSVSNSNTLQPVRHASYNTQRDMVLNFGRIVNGYYNDNIKDENTIIHDSTTMAYFDSNIYPVLIGWLPLQDGYKKDISIYDYNPLGKKGVLKASVQNVKSGSLQTSSGLREVWIVTVSDEISNEANVTSLYYFDKADRKLWKQEINAGERKMLLLRAGE